MVWSLGVDLGTTFTSAAAFADGRVEVVSLETHRVTTPTLIHVRDGEFTYGSGAQARAGADPSGTAREFKRRLGDPVPIVIGETPYRAEQLLASFAKWVVERVSTERGSEPESVVITHPANWTEFQLDRLRTALAESGLGAVVLVSEPEAAASDYAAAATLEPNDHLLVYDLGGGTFDVALLTHDRGRFRQVGEAAGVERLGGIDFDEAVFEHVLGRVPPEVRQDALQSDAGRMAIGQLRRSCVEAKESLSSDVAVDIPVVLPSYSDTIRLNRAEFEQMIRPMLFQTVELVRRVVDRAGLGEGDLTAVLLVGGSSRIPLVAELVANELGVPVRVDAHPKLVVARGAARITQQDRGRESDPSGGWVTRTRLAIAGVAALAIAAIVGIGAVIFSGDSDATTDGGEPTTTASSSTTAASTSSVAPTTQPEPEPTPIVLPEGEPLVLEVWHPGLPDATVASLVESFEQENPEISVNLTSISGYSVLLRTTIDTPPEERPNIVILADRGVQAALDGLDVVPVQEMIDQDDYDLDLLVPNAVDRYSTPDGLAALPFNVSVPSVYLNLDLVEQIGLDPSAQPTWTTAELLDACAQLASLVPTCIEFDNAGWTYTELLATSGGVMFDNDNGRSARATEVQADADPLGRDVFDFLVRLTDDDVGTERSGRPTFYDQGAAMYLTSAALLASVDEGVRTSENPFRLGGAWLPTVENARPGGVVTGGGALWLLEAGDDREEIASWMLMDFLTSVPAQIEFHRATGYLPVRVDAELDDGLATFWAENPAFRVGFDQLLAVTLTDDDVAARGGRAGPFHSIDGRISSAVRDVDAGTINNDQAFARMVDESNSLLVEYLDSIAS